MAYSHPDSQHTPTPAQPEVFSLFFNTCNTWILAIQLCWAPQMLQRFPLVRVGACGSTQLGLGYQYSQCLCLDNKGRIEGSSLSHSLRSFRWEGHLEAIVITQSIWCLLSHWQSWCWDSVAIYPRLAIINAIPVFISVLRTLHPVSVAIVSFSFILFAVNQLLIDFWV